MNHNSTPDSANNSDGCNNEKSNSAGIDRKRKATEMIQRNARTPVSNASTSLESSVGTSPQPQPQPAIGGHLQNFNPASYAILQTIVEKIRQSQVDQRQRQTIVGMPLSMFQTTTTENINSQSSTPNIMTSIPNHSIASFVQNLVGSTNSSSIETLLAAAVVSSYRIMRQHTAPANNLTMQQMIPLLISGGNYHANSQISLPRSQDVSLQIPFPVEPTVIQHHLLQYCRNSSNSNATQQNPPTANTTAAYALPHESFASRTNEKTASIRQDQYRTSAKPMHSTTETKPTEPSVSFLMALPTDNAAMSQYQALVRLNLEYFVSTDAEIQYGVQGRKIKVKDGQVGVRCRHCCHIPIIKNRGRGAFYYPSTFKAVYTTAQNISVNHLLGSCPCIPRTAREALMKMRSGVKATCSVVQESSASKPTRKKCKTYWVETCSSSGLCEGESGGIFLASKR